MKLDKLYFKYSICCSKIKQMIEKRRVRRKLIKHIASVIASKERELYSSYYPHLWSFEDVKQVCEDLSLPYTTKVERNIRYVYLDRD